MQEDSSTYLAQSDRLWEVKIKEQFKPEISFQEAKGNKKIIWLRYKTIFTTMTPAETWDLEKIKPNECLVFQAEAQTQGKGQGSNVWASPPGNVYLTALTEVDPTLNPHLSILACSAVIRTVKEVLPQQKVHNKWVNDIFIEKKKVGGCLAQGIQYGPRCFGVFGIGVNIHEAPLKGTSCLQQHSSKQLSVKEFSEKLVHNLLYALANKEESFKLYKASLALIGQHVSIFDRGLNTVEHEGIFKGINQYGNAILEHNNEQKTVIEGRMRAYIAEICWERLKGRYVNELNSTMWIEEIDEQNLTFKGKYSTGAGRPPPEELFAVNGHFQKCNEKMCVISWIVNWKHEKKAYNSIASFNGYGVFEEKDNVTIRTNWLLTYLDPLIPSEEIGLYELSQAKVGPNIFKKQLQ